MYDCICTIDNKCVYVPYIYVEHEYCELISSFVLVCTVYKMWQLSDSMSIYHFVTG